MSTAGFLLTVTTAWNVSSDKVEKGRLPRGSQHLASIAAETARELRETPATREQALCILRDWLKQNGDVRNVRQGKFTEYKFNIPLTGLGLYFLVM